MVSGFSGLGFGVEWFWVEGLLPRGQGSVSAFYGWALGF